MSLQCADVDSEEQGETMSPCGHDDLALIVLSQHLEHHYCVALGNEQWTLTPSNFHEAGGKSNC